MNIEQLIKDKVPGMNELGKVYVTPDIPDKKINNAVASYAKDVESGFILAVIDTTIFGSGKEGFLFTGNRMYAEIVDLFLKRLRDARNVDS